MSEAKQKLKRMLPLVKVRKNQVNLEAAILSSIRQAKLSALNELQKFQDAYIQGVDKLNQERMSSKRDRLQTLERGVDLVKSQWHLAIRNLQNIENQGRAQLALVVIAERNLKSVEKLEERYQGQHDYSVRQTEQKLSDEAALRKTQK